MWGDVGSTEFLRPNRVQNENCVQTASKQQQRPSFLSFAQGHNKDASAKVGSSCSRRFSASG